MIEAIYWIQVIFEETHEEAVASYAHAIATGQLETLMYALGF
jgi:hypothetical protein